MVEAADHVHINACQEGFSGGGCHIVGDPVIHEFREGGVIAVHNSLKSPFPSQDLRQGKGIGGSGHAIQRIESAHYRGDAFFDGRVEGRQVELTQGVFGKFDRIVIAAALCCAITDEMFCASGDTVGDIQARSLIAAHVSAGDHRAEIGILAGPFRHAAPACVPRDVHHRREGPADAAGGSFLRSDASGLLD